MSDKKSSLSGKRSSSFLTFGPRRSDGNYGSSSAGLEGAGAAPPSVGGTGEEVRLDDEMDKVFASMTSAGSGIVGGVGAAVAPDKEKFDVASLSATPPVVEHLHDDMEYSLHRKKSYPHMHAPLKATHSRGKRERAVSVGTGPNVSTSISPRNSESEASESVEPQSLSQTKSVQDRATSLDQDDTSLAYESVLLSSESEPQISERAATHTAPDGSPILGGVSRVQFSPRRGDGTSGGDQYKDGDIDDGDRDVAPDKTKRKSRHHHHHHHKSRKYSLQEDPEARKQSGAERSGAGSGTGSLSVSGSSAPRRISMQPEDSQLEEHDQDDLVSHRSDDPRGLRRHKIQQKASSNSFVHIARKEEGHKLTNLLTQSTLKKLYDHSPHEVFVQLDELKGSGDDREWKETARWIKYEENVEEGSDRWGRPHVASLSFHSLLNLRRCLETGAVLLDLDEKDLPGVAYRIVEQMLVDELILEDDKPIIMRALLLRHRHVFENDRGFMFGSRRKFSSYTSLQNLSDDKGSKRNLPSSTLHIDLLTRNALGSNRRLGLSETRVDMKEETYTASQEDLVKKTHNEAILRRIPTGAEATAVLVGSVEFLDHPTIAFVRLASGVPMPTLTEVPIPVRFMFVLLGPDDSDLDYHEVGRSIATLMANRPFHQVAYKAEDRRELLSAINEFLDDSIVLPPGDWERQALLPFDEIKAKSERIRQRRLKEVGDGKAGAPGGPGVGGDHGQVDKGKGGKGEIFGDGGGKKPRRDPLEKTGKLFGGLINDIKYRFPFYLSDYTDALNSQCIAATIFMYFAALSTAITFGGLLSDKTHNLIGISETLVAASACGIIFALFAGQPMVIIGTTGPLLLLDESLYQFCINNDIDFLTCRLYMGFWMGVTAIVVALFEGSRLVKLFTRFTEEIFSALISLIYIFESIMKLIYVFKRNPLLPDYCTLSFFTGGLFSTTGANYTTDSAGNYTTEFSMYEDDFNNTDPWKMNINDTVGTKLPTYDAVGPLNQPNTALFCLILALGTFTIAYYLRIFRNGHFLGRNARRALGDFGVPIAIVIMVAIDYLVPGTYTDKLSVPEGLSPSDPENRGWVIPLLGKDPENPFPVWAMFASLVPGILVYILVFMETHISELIIDKPERNLKKGSGFHMDIVLICILNAVCGVMGAPWHCAATVRSVTHVAALTVMSTTHAPGEAPHIVEVKEQRMSALFVSLLVGLSVLMSNLLRLVPMSVLFGVFLYMGVSSTSGVQFFDRLQLFFMPVKHHPRVPYVRRVQTYKMHLFTCVQLVGLALLWVVKSSRASLAFPFFLIMMVPLRQKLSSFFSPEELQALDGKQPDGSTEDEPDFYEQAPLPG